MVRSRKNGKPLKQEEITKHFAAIEASVNKTARKIKTPKIPHITVQEAHESEAPEGTGPEGSNNYSTGRTKKAASKRKRKEPKDKNGMDSDSTDNEEVPTNKRSKRSRISASEESTGNDQDDEAAGAPETIAPEPAPHEETPQEYHRRMQHEIRQGKKGHSDETRNRLRNRSNKLFDHEGVNRHGNKFYRRNPREKFKPPPVKPGEGGAIINHEKGKMLKAKKITEEQTAGQTLRPYLNGVGFQYRLAAAIRKLRQLSLPAVKRNKRIRGKGGNPTQLRVDKRLRYALVTLRRLKRAHDAFDQWNNPQLGAFPVYEGQRKIPLISLMDSSENETEKRRSHPKGFMGTELKNKKEGLCEEAPRYLKLPNALFRTRQ